MSDWRSEIPTVAGADPSAELLKALAATEPFTRTTAAETVADLNVYSGEFAAAAVPLLLGMLTDEHNAARRPAALSLGKFHAHVSAEHCGAIAALLANEENAPMGGGYISVRRAALLAFTALCEPASGAVPEAVAACAGSVAGLCEHADADAREMAARAMAALAGAADQLALVKLLADDELDVRSASTDSLVRLSGVVGLSDPATSALAAHLEKAEDSDVRAAAAAILGKVFGGKTSDTMSKEGVSAEALLPSHVDTLTAALADESVSVRTAAATALGDACAKHTVADPTAVAAAIAALLEDPEPAVRAAAAGALGALRAYAYADTLAEMIGDRSKAVRDAATAATKRMEAEDANSDSSF